MSARAQGYAVQTARTVMINAELLAHLRVFAIDTVIYINRLIKEGSRNFAIVERRATRVASKVLKNFRFLAKKNTSVQEFRHLPCERSHPKPDSSKHAPSPRKIKIHCKEGIQRRLIILCERTSPEIPTKPPPVWRDPTSECHSDEKEAYHRRYYLGMIHEQAALINKHVLINLKGSWFSQVH